ncbi:unnamed protein product [Rotaria magnacalcarata]|uniref:Prenylcysteine lyase domain-containing protein n=1 Tax=Rotaria magnacalcarata TaxID=392030 RepID=A0A815E936_9BILA|nr:unnamed protein product [Rotaria magnacalcarata]CAF1307198.1 unnamed protein product [Rotaria magnacalcarata]CAF2158698.1 unnamed protein product [Rotaria magnacalcarata]CAF3910339.1 unnamed protein product [Rotaria magnacalcarata]CAF4024404.1 unnamed protein product [Rotaria magnacalcarata]
MIVRLGYILSILCIIVQCEHHETPKTHIAIIGAGIGGIATAYWLKYYLNDSVAITIYESDQVGGRLRTLNIDEVEYEAGGTIIHDKNLYMKRLVDELGLKQLNHQSSFSYLITDDGSQTLFSTLSRYIPSIFHVIWRYGLDAFRFKFWLDKKLSNFLRIYDYQDNGRTFETVEEFLQMLDQDFYAATRYSFRKYLFEKGFHKRFIDEIAQMATLVNYDQSVDAINAFPGLVSLMASGSTLWHVEGGNYLVPKKMLENLLKQSDVQFVKGYVKSVAETHRIDVDDQGGNVRLSYQPSTSDLVNSVDYDHIVIAFPLHRDNIADFVVQATDSFYQYDYRMQSTHANFLHGKLDCQKYNLTDDECQRLNAIFYTKSSLPYRCVAQQQPVNLNEEQNKKPDKSVYKIFSPEELNLLHYEQIFDKENFKLIQDIPWLAYPKYEHPQKLPPIQINKNIFYLNAMEWSSSCMEIEVISARNIALLVAKKLGVELKHSDKHVEF